MFGVCIGLGEAILCRRGHAVPLATAHSPATNKEERQRVKEAGGFISQVYTFISKVSLINKGVHFKYSLSFSSFSR